MTRTITRHMTLAATDTGTLAEPALALRRAPPAAMPLMRRLRLCVLSVVTAATVMTATAMPAHADRRSDDFAKALAAIAAIALIANQLQDRDVRPYRPPVVQPHRPPVVTHPRPQRPHPEPSRRPRVPSVCAIEIEDDYDISRVYGERCLRREGFDYRLPQRCAREVRLQGRDDRIYTERCLRDAGFRIGRRDY